LIVEDHPAIAEGLVALLGSEPDVTVVGHATDRLTARELIAAHDPDVVLCDVMQGGVDGGLALLGDFAGAVRPAFVMYSAYGNPAFLAKALDLGAAAYVSKLASAEAILTILRHVSAGHRSFGGEVLRAARGALRRPTRRELETIVLLDEGCSNKEVAERLNVRLKTVESQLRRLFDRYGVPNRASLVHLARTEGWIVGQG
ncbi:MAG: response regulator transcription factor, partial [Chloroflexota bacterium]